MDQPENLQLIKDEPTTPPHLSTPVQVVTSPNIKERLNLHVKRRLQQDVVGGITASGALNMHTAAEQQAPSSSLHNIEPTSLIQRKDNSDKEQKPKQRRPYQKRTDKLNPQPTESGATAAAGVQRKYKRHKMKHTQLNNVASALAANLTQGSNSDGAMSEGGGSLTYGGVGGEHAEDEGSQDDGAADAEGRGSSGTGRDKDKCPDVLGLVLSIKKRALMQDPEVQQFLGRLMEAIKS